MPVDPNTKRRSGNSRLTNTNLQMIKRYGLHLKCELAWSAKCNWEHMSRLAVFREWPSIICDECRNFMIKAWKLHEE